jgi:methionyl-tRNA formyltransferase
MRILFAGTPTTAATVLEGLIASGHEVVAVLTREDSLVGRKKVLTPSPVALAAEKYSLPVIRSSKLTPEVLQSISEFKAELAVVVAYGVILQQDALDSVANGWFNLHFSHLPRWRGAAPVQRAIQAGDAEIGVSLFRIDTGLDTGPVLAVADTIIELDESAGDLLSRLAKIGVSLLNQELPRLYSGSYELTEQMGEVSLAPKLNRDDARIDFSKRALEVSNLVRAMNPEPIAWCQLGGESLRVLRARPVESPIELSLGEVMVDGSRVLVGCGDRSTLELLEVQPASKNVMSAHSWMNGQSDKVVLE